LRLAAKPQKTDSKSADPCGHGGSPPSRHQQNKEFKLNWPLESGEAKIVGWLLVFTVASGEKRATEKKVRLNLDVCVSLFPSSEGDDPFGEGFRMCCHPFGGRSGGF
jgi:hypothetical protein